MEEKSQTKERICANCKWVRYIGGGTWICTREREGSSFGAMEVLPLQSGCNKWEKK